MKTRELAILYEDDNIIVINKDAHLPSQGGAGIRYHLLRLLTEKYGSTPRLLHRLDKETSGLIVVVKGTVLHRDLAAYYKGFQRGSKFYRLLVKGRFARQNFSYLSTRMTSGGKEKSSATSYRVLQNFGKYSYLEAKLGTGREHQIRRDMAELGHPILGDDKYGDFALNKTLKHQYSTQTLYLVAYKIKWGSQASLHPHFKGRKFEIPLPPVFTDFLARYNVTP